MAKKEYCPLCGKKAFYHKIMPVTRKYRGHSIHIEQPGYWCDSCGDGVIGGADRKATQKELQAFRAKVDGLLTPDEVKRIRKKLKLTQKEASEIFGGGINAFSRYERGEIPVYKSTSALLKILAHHPEQLDEIR